MGGILIEILKDVQIGLAPLNNSEIKGMIQNLNAYPILEGYRGKEGVNLEQFAEIIQKVSDLVTYLPEIAELDINPLMANENSVIAVDARIRIEVE